MTLSELPPAASRNASAMAVDVIRDAITEGRFEPGQRLKEEELAREFGISRTPIREALLVLQVEGLIDTAPNRGASVRSYRSVEIDEMYRLRALLEGHAAHRAASTITLDQIRVLHASCERFDRLRLDQVPELVKENAVFHDTVLDAANSERLREMVRQVVHLPLQYTSWMWYTPQQLEVSGHYHRRIAHALEARDTQRAEGLMKAHVLESRDVLVARLEDLEQSVDGRRRHR